MREAVASVWMTRKILRAPEPDEDGSRIAEAILDFVGRIPSTAEPKSDEPVDRARSVAMAAAAKAAISAGALALPPGPFGWLTILPELVAIWKIQAQMVADIAGAFGKEASLAREQMLYCLFRHTAAQAVRDLVIRVGGRFLIGHVTLRAAQVVAKKVGIRITQRAIGTGVSRWLPIVGALGVAGYAYYDTAQVARTTIDLFQQQIEIESE
jgi:hypothetical protein